MMREIQPSPLTVTASRASFAGFSLIEMVVVMGIFSIIMAGAFSAYLSQVKHSTREYKLAESEVELGIAKNILVRDLELAGYGIAESYTGSVPAIGTVRAYSATNGAAGNPDTLTIRGTAIGMNSRAAQGWSYVSAQPSPTSFGQWSDAREDLQVGDAVILIEPTARQLLTEDPTDLSLNNWLFTFNGFNNDLTLVSEAATTTNPAVGTLVYGVEVADPAASATQPYSAVRYYLGSPSDSPENCAPGTASLLRAESTTADAPGSGSPLLACVRDFQVAFNLRDDSASAGVWDNGGVTAGGYTAVQMRNLLKQVRLFLLVQTGNRDAEYTHPLTTIMVGDTVAGQNVALTTEQSHYRWRLVTLSVTPRNIR